MGESGWRDRLTGLQMVKLAAALKLPWDSATGRESPWGGLESAGSCSWQPCRLSEMMAPSQR